MVQPSGMRPPFFALLDSTSVDAVILASSAQAPQLLEILLAASPTVKGVLGLLALMSTLCWFVLGAKWLSLGQAKSSSYKFLEYFWEDVTPHWSAERLERIYSKVSLFRAAPLAAVFRAGYVELARMSGAEGAPAGQNGWSAGDLDTVERALRRTIGTELTRMESMLSWLATTASSAPFIGLFGTVWGIMNSFLAIAGQKNVGLDVVAPGIAEALVATAAGLAAAIPAAMGYNYLVRRLRILESEMDAFANDYLNIVRRYFLRS